VLTLAPYFGDAGVGAVGAPSGVRSGATEQGVIPFISLEIVVARAAAQRVGKDAASRTSHPASPKNWEFTQAKP
jgi:hypothetical protein